MLSILVLLSVLSGLGFSIAYITQNFIILSILIAIFILIVTISKKNFVIGLLLIFLFAVLNGINTYKIILETMKYKPLTEDTAVEGVVKDFFDINGENYIYFIRSNRIEGENKKLVLKVYSKDIPPPKNSEIKIRGKILKNDHNMIFYQNTLSLFPENTEVIHVSKFYEFLSNLRLKIVKNVRSTLKSEEGDLLLSSLIGINTLESDTKTDFQLSGTAHILAISGLHIGIFFLFFSLAFKFIGIFSFLFALAFTFLFLVFIGLKFSAIRAFIMLVVLVLSNQLGRGRNLLNSLLVAMSVILILFPDALISLSFYLSCLAILGIVVASNFKFKSQLLNALNISFFVNFYEAPLMINFFKNISIVSLVINLIVIPYMGVLLPIGLIYIIVSLISVNIASHFSILINLLYGILIFVVSVVSRTPFSYAPGSFTLFQFIAVEILIFIATLYLFSKKNKSTKFVITCSVIILVLSFLSYNSLSDRVIVDSFQDSKVIIAKSAGESFVFIQEANNSSDKYLDNILRESGINKINALVLLKNPTIKEGSQINELTNKRISIVKVYAVPLVSKDYLKTNFPNYVTLPNEFSINFGNIKIEYKNSTSLKIFLKNKVISP